MNHRVVAGVAEFELADYQRAVRTVLRHPLISERYPDQKALPLVRRWAGELRTDLAESFGYRLELSSTSARLVRAIDHLDPTLPAHTRSGRDKLDGLGPLPDDITVHLDSATTRTRPATNSPGAG